MGATDAAVSCSILLSLAQYITPYLALVTKHVSFLHWGEVNKEIEPMFLSTKNRNQSTTNCRPPFS